MQAVQHVCCDLYTQGNRILRRSASDILQLSVKQSLEKPIVCQKPALEFPATIYRAINAGKLLVHCLSQQGSKKQTHRLYTV